MNKDKISHRRSIYTFWDFLGDVGGLFDMLKLLVKPILAIGSLLFGSGLDKFLFESVFKV